MINAVCNSAKSGVSTRSVLPMLCFRRCWYDGMLTRMRETPKWGCVSQSAVVGLCQSQHLHCAIAIGRMSVCVSVSRFIAPILHTWPPLFCEESQLMPVRAYLPGWYRQSVIVPVRPGSKAGMRKWLAASGSFSHCSPRQSHLYCQAVSSLSPSWSTSISQ